MFKDWGNCVRGAATLDCLPIVFSNFLNALLMFVGIFALSVFILGGFTYMNSGGDPKKLESARGALTFGILGVILVLLSFVIINIISFVTGAECIKFGNFSLGCN